jgi:hypothetical protein
MDKFETGVFEISTAFSDFYQPWQEELAKEDLKRRARTACERVQRDGVPYVTCLYPVEKKDGKLVLKGFVALAQWQDCEIGEAVFTQIHKDTPFACIDWLWTGDDACLRFHKEASTNRNDYSIEIHRRIA